MDKRIKLSQDAAWGWPKLQRGKSPTQVLEKRSDDRKGQADWMQATGNLDPRIVQWIREYRGFDDDNVTFVLVAPLGADESWEETINGDAFERFHLEGPQGDEPKWGHKTFETGGHAFMHHRNGDPSRGFGDFPLMVYNRQSDRCEGIWRLFSDLAALVPGATSLIESYRSGKDFPISMGCRVPFDICSICGNKAPTQDKYCVHTRDPGFGHIYPQDHPKHGSKKVRVFNPFPSFIDLSGVTVNAAPEATPLGMLFPELIEFLRGGVGSQGGLLVASHSEIRSRQAGGRAKTSGTVTAIKRSDILKEIPVLSSEVISPMLEREPSCGKEQLLDLWVRAGGLRGVLSTLGGLGICAKPQEFAHLLRLERDLDEDLPAARPSDIQRGLAMDVDWVDDLSVNARALLAALPMTQERSVLYPHLARRVLRGVKDAPPAPKVRITIEVSSPMDGWGVSYGSYLRALSQKMGHLVERVLHDFPQTARDFECCAPGQDGVFEKGGAPNPGLLAQALLPSLSVLCRACGPPPASLVLQSVRSHNSPRTAHLFGGVLQ